MCEVERSKLEQSLLFTWNLVMFDFGLWAGSGQEAGCIWK